MQAQAINYDAVNEISNDLDPVELLQTVMSLRQDVSSISGDVQAVLQENAKLKKEVTRLQDSRKSNSSLSDIRRLKRELDQMVNLHDSISGGRAKPARAPQRREAVSSQEPTNSAWMKKMMMVMMMAEMV